MEEWKKRLTLAREQKGLSKSDFAKLIPVSPPTVTDWEKPSAIRGIKEIKGPNLTKVCAVLGISAEWLLNGVESSEGAKSPDKDRPLESYDIPASRFKKVPVIGKGMGGLPEERNWTDADFPAGASDDYAEIATSDPNAFIARVEESSMAPRYNPGEYFLVEPNTTPETGDDVLVRFANDGTSLKRYLSRRDGFIGLGSYNTTSIITVRENEISWMYYVAHPVPTRKIKPRF